jgi:hypothetical protein
MTVISYVKSHVDRARDNALLATGNEYSLTLKNDSAQPWTFYVYQQMPKQSANVFSLAWFCSPFQINVGN